MIHRNTDGTADRAPQAAGLAAWRQAGLRFAHGGLGQFYRRGGAGSAGALLCLHGFPTASWDWHALWPILVARFARVLAPDLLGFGWSDKPPGHAYSVLDQADRCEALLAAEGVRRIHLLAHDLGDSVAQELLARDLARRAEGAEGLIVLSAVFLNGGLFPEVHRPRLVQRLLLTPLGPWLVRRYDARRFGRSLAAVFGPRTQPSAQQLQEFWQLLCHDDGLRVLPQLIGYIPERRARRARWVGALQRTPAPLRLIVGLADPVSGAPLAARYSACVPRADVVPLPGIGHYPQIEAAEAVAAAFLAFHDRLAARGGPA